MSLMMVVNNCSRRNCLESGLTKRYTTTVKYVLFFPTGGFRKRH
jgi:hypothetical protein